MDAFLNFTSFYLPPSTLDNEDLSQELGNWTSNQIFSKTGIKKRHISGPNEFSSDLAEKAFKNLITENNINKNEIDYLIYVTQTPEYIIPSGSFVFQSKLDLTLPSTDISAGCSGFMNGLFLAKSLIISKSFKTILLITTETYSKIIHRQDKSVRTLFGDGATATIITTRPIGYRIGNFDLGTLPNDYQKLIVPGIGLKSLDQQNLDISTTDDNGYVRTPKNIYMDGPSILSFTLDVIPKSIEKTLLLNNLSSIEMISHIILHQASLFVLKTLKSKLNLTEKQNFIINLEDKGNTVSSTIPIALKENNDVFKKGEYILLSGFGVGLSWASCVLKKV
jgi:3-oxoacyl-[acyl-carrier-protein] synthase-3